MSLWDRILSFICTYAACSTVYPPPKAPATLRKINPEDLVTHTNSGLVQGFQMYSFSENLIGAYEGIPFAEPPVGSLRFRVSLFTFNIHASNTVNFNLI